jgi:hypothetical protein
MSDNIHCYNHKKCEIWGSHSEDVDHGLYGFDAVQSYKW